MTYIPAVTSIIDSNNSTTVTLAANGVFTGTATDVSRYNSIVISAYSNVSSINNGVQLQFSIDGTNWHTIYNDTCTASIILSKTYNVVMKYFRIVYTNSTVIQTTFRLQLLLKVDTVELNNYISLVNSYSSTMADGDIWNGLWEDTERYSQISTFVTTSSKVYVSFEYSSNASTLEYTTNEVKAMSNKYNSINEIPIKKYFRIKLHNKENSAITVSLDTKLLVSPVDVSEKITGTDDNYNFKGSVNCGFNKLNKTVPVKMGYRNEMQIGFEEPYGSYGTLISEKYTPMVQLGYLYNTGQINPVTVGAGSISTVTNGYINISPIVSSGSYAYALSDKRVMVRTAQSCVSRFSTVFSAAYANSIQLSGVGNFIYPTIQTYSENGIFFGYNGTSFGILHRNNNVNTWVLQSEWNVDKLNGTGTSSMILDPTKGNTYQIVYKNTGISNINCYIEDSDTGRFILVHIFKFSNTSTSTVIKNSSFNLIWAIYNTGTVSTRMSMLGTGGTIYSEGTPLYLGPMFSDSAIRTLSGSTNHSIINIRCTTVMGSMYNYGYIRLKNLMISCSTASSNATTIKVVINPTISGTLTWVSIHNDSMVQSCVTGTSMTGGYELKSYVTALAHINTVIDLSDITLEPLDVLSISGMCNVNNGSPVTGIALNWIEQ